MRSNNSSGCDVLRGCGLIVLGLKCSCPLLLKFLGLGLNLLLLSVFCVLNYAHLVDEIVLGGQAEDIVLQQPVRGHEADAAVKLGV